MSKAPTSKVERVVGAYTLNEYQVEATKTSVYPGKWGVLGKVYCALKLNGEAGEAAEHIGKALRDDNQEFKHERIDKIILELGDCLWYIAALAGEFGFTLEEIAKMNIQKLANRKARGTLGGSGDER